MYRCFSLFKAYKQTKVSEQERAVLIEVKINNLKALWLFFLVIRTSVFTFT